MFEMTLEEEMYIYTKISQRCKYCKQEYISFEGLIGYARGADYKAAMYDSELAVLEPLRIKFAAEIFKKKVEADYKKQEPVYKIVNA